MKPQGNTSQGESYNPGDAILTEIDRGMEFHETQFNDLKGLRSQVVAMKGNSNAGIDASSSHDDVLLTPDGIFPNRIAFLKGNPEQVNLLTPEGKSLKTYGLVNSDGYFTAAGAKWYSKATRETTSGRQYDDHSIISGTKEGVGSSAR